MIPVHPIVTTPSRLRHVTHRMGWLVKAAGDIRLGIKRRLNGSRTGPMLSKVVAPATALSLAPRSAGGYKFDRSKPPGDPLGPFSASPRM